MNSFLVAHKLPIRMSFTIHHSHLFAPNYFLQAKHNKRLNFHIIKTLYNRFSFFQFNVGSSEFFYFTIIILNNIKTNISIDISTIESLYSKLKLTDLQLTKLELSGGFQLTFSTYYVFLHIIQCPSSSNQSSLIYKHHCL